MSQGEFDIIKRYFHRPTQKLDGVEIGIGDDCAILDIPAGYQLAVTTDSLVSGVHFFEDVDAYRLGYKSLAVNLSDLAAMGATAKWVSLAITLPKVDEAWLAEFCSGFFASADKYNVQLIGGDTTKGPLSITVSAKGIVKTGQALTRSRAQVGDIVCVSGCLGDGALGLAVKLFSTDTRLLTEQSQQAFINALELTEPRLHLAQLLSGYATSCIDISDGLSQDLSHILNKSQCNAEIALEHLPFSNAMLNEIKRGHLSLSQAWQYAINGGDDYELLFTIPADKITAFKTLLKTQSQSIDLACYSIGKVTEYKQVDFGNTMTIPIEPSILFTHLQQPIDLNSTGWDHFK